MEKHTKVIPENDQDVADILKICCCDDILFKSAMGLYEALKEQGKTLLEAYKDVLIALVLTAPLKAGDNHVSTCRKE